MEEPSGESTGSRWSRWQLFGLYAAAIIAWLFLSIPPHEGEDTATYAGRFTGGAVAFLLFGMLVWLVIWLFNRRRLAFWTPWIFVLAAGFAFLGKVNDVGERLQREEKAEAVIERTGGPSSTPVKQCVTGALDEFEKQPSEERERIPWTDAQFKKVAVRYCQEMETRGFLDDPSQTKVNTVMADVVGEMQDSGELPPAAPVG